MWSYIKRRKCPRLDAELSSDYSQTENVWNPEDAWRWFQYFDNIFPQFYLCVCYVTLVRTEGHWGRVRGAVSCGGLKDWTQLSSQNILCFQHNSDSTFLKYFDLHFSWTVWAINNSASFSVQKLEAETGHKSSGKKANCDISFVLFFAGLRFIQSVESYRICLWCLRLYIFYLIVVLPWVAE